MIHVEEKIKKNCLKISEESLGLTVNDIKNGEDLEKAKELGADDDFLKKKSVVLTKFLEKVSIKKQTKEEGRSTITDRKQIQEWSCYGFPILGCNFHDAEQN